MSLATKPRIIDCNGNSVTVAQEVFDAFKEFSQDSGVNGKIEIFYKDGGINDVKSTKEKRYKFTREPVRV